MPRYRRLLAAPAITAIALSMTVQGPVPDAAAHEDSSDFADVPASGDLSDLIDDLADAGILDGTECAPNMFCPREPIPRWVMAVWLVRTLDGHNPRRGASRFDDVGPGLWWAGHTERLAQLGVTKGCSADPVLFCPHDPVTRAEMATFLVRAFDLDEAAPAGFVDTAGNAHAANIDALAAAGVTLGCSTSPRKYCPDDSVTRAEMATFLTRALDSQGLTLASSPGGNDSATSASYPGSTDGFGCEGG